MTTTLTRRMNGRIPATFLVFLLLFALLATTQTNVLDSGPVASYIIQAEDLIAAKTAVTQTGAQITHELGIINSVAADLTSAQYAALDRQGFVLHENTAVHSASTIFSAYHSSDVPKSISSSGSPSISSVINVPSGGTIASVKVLNLQGSHTYVGDLDFNLISPQGTEVQILNLGRCGGDENFDIHLDDSAASGNFPCPPTDGGAYQPSNALSAFAGEDSQGTWTLRVDDNANADGGSLDSWSLEIGVDDAPPPSDPPSGSAYQTHTVRDEFNTNAWNNNDGDTDWLDEWMVTYGRTFAQVTNGQLQISGSEFDFIIREFYAKDAVSAMLSFTYQRNFVSSTDGFKVYWGNGYGGSHHKILTVSGAGIDTTPQQVTIDLTPYLDNPDRATIKFYDSYAHLDDNSSLLIDDVQITFTTYRPDTDYTTLVDAYLAHNQGLTGDGIAVAVVDTGL
ncbi:MAG: hypothetical protein GY803_12255, partial [Chloroflexi bacterium]|nr:hypothetical protein [Chloroflexota bacterium]